MRPFQLWLPVVEESSIEIAGYKEQAFAAWRSESRVWLLPELKGPQRWQDEGGWWSRRLAVPGLISNRVDIFYIAEDGKVGGPGATKRFPSGCVEGLLKTWLNLNLAPIVDDSHEPAQRFRLWRPYFDGPDVTYREVLFGYARPSAADLAAYLDAGPTFSEERSPDRSSHSSGVI
jgi:hypothetical protein